MPCGYVCMYLDSQKKKKRHWDIVPLRWGRAMMSHGP